MTSFPFFPPAICLLLIPGGKSIFSYAFQFLVLQKMEFYTGLLLFNIVKVKKKS